MVDVNVIYDDESGQVTGRSLVSARTELVDKTWREGKDDLGYPCIGFIAKSGRVSASRLAAIASIEPHDTRISRSGS